MTPGAVYTPSIEMQSGGFTQDNHIDLDFHNGVATLGSLRTDVAQLTIMVTPSVPQNTISLGFGMGTATAVATVAVPNFRYDVTDGPDYFIAIAKNMRQGEILNLDMLTSNLKLIERINLSSDARNLAATLTPANQWNLAT
jgi:hypothetical protein